ncbi:MAG: energy-coupled thiamine transporter ThiT [Oscillospiraceae bacterium]|nr:energy-coupled thiamine transporter ThiT [Oscillospiraceae bacterium]
MKTNTRRLVETAILIALGTVLSLFKLDMPMGGGLTVCSMLPLILLSHRWGWRWGLVSAGVYSVLQLLLGLDNVGYAAAGGLGMALGCLFLDYILAYLVIGFSGVFEGPVRDKRAAMAVGIAVTFFARFLCHFVTGVWIWDALWPNEFGMAAIPYSAAYNGWYMAGELVLTEGAAMLLYKPLRRYLCCEDLKERAPQ